MIQDLSPTQKSTKTRLLSRAVSCKLCSIVFVLLTIVSSQALLAQTKVTVSSLQELREAIQGNNQAIAMKPGRYALTDLPEKSRNLAVSGSKNTIDLSGVFVSVPVGSTGSEYISISGDDNVFEGGTFEDVYKSGLDKVSDFSAYNKDRRTLASGLGGDAVLGVHGNDNTVANTKLTVRGSYPYGYGSIYGIGANNAFGLNKRCGLVVRGKRNTVDGVEIQQRAFGHGIFIQRPADKTVVKNCIVEGRMRPSKDLYEETDPDDLPVRSKYKIKTERNRDDGPPIPKDTMLPLSEDGIRVYADGGSVIVDNCTVKKMRGGIRLYLSGGGVVSNCTAIDCGLTNYNLPSRGVITESTGNFANAPLIDFPGSKSGQVVLLTIVPSSQIAGPHNIADIDGNNHTIVFQRKPGPVATNLRPIVIGASKSTIRNETEYPILLKASASKNTVLSVGPVTNQGSENVVKQINQSADSREDQYRVWTSKGGVKVLAKSIGQKGSSVTLETIDGAQVTGKLRDLSKADRQYLTDKDKAPMRTWTSTSGYKVDARLVGKKKDAVTLEKADGSSVDVPLDKLIKADQDYLDKH